MSSVQECRCSHIPSARRDLVWPRLSKALSLARALSISPLTLPVVSHLRDLPHTLSSIPLPLADLKSSSSQISLSEALRELEVEGTAEGRHTVLLAASLIPAEAHWEAAAWAWAAEDAPVQGDDAGDASPNGGASGPASGSGGRRGAGAAGEARRNLSAGGEEAERVVQWIADALARGVFKNGDAYVQEGLGRYKRGDRCRRVLVRWGVTDLSVRSFTAEPSPSNPPLPSRAGIWH